MSWMRCPIIVILVAIAGCSPSYDTVKCDPFNTHTTYFKQIAIDGLSISISGSKLGLVGKTISIHVQPAPETELATTNELPARIKLKVCQASACFTNPEELNTGSQTFRVSEHLQDPPLPESISIERIDTIVIEQPDFSDPSMEVKVNIDWDSVGKPCY